MANVVLPPVPYITSRGMPEEEADAVFILSGALGSLSKYVEDFAAAINLFEFALSQFQQNPQIGRWMHIAGRDGAMTLYHFAKTIEIVRGSLNETPTIQGLIDAAQSRLAYSLLNSHFPNVEPMRTAVAHAGELGSSTAKFKRNAFSGSQQTGGFDLRDVEGVMISDSFNGRTYTNTFEGSILAYDLTVESLRHLVSALERFYAAFDGATDAARLADSSK